MPMRTPFGPRARGRETIRAVQSLYPRYSNPGRGGGRQAGAHCPGFGRGLSAVRIRTLVVLVALLWARFAVGAVGRGAGGLCVAGGAGVLDGRAGGWWMS